MRRRSLRYGPRKPGERPDPSLPAGADRLPQIEHVVILMMENHSYDNYFGMLQGRGEGFPLDADGEPDVANVGLDGVRVRAHHLSGTVQVPDVPSQSWHASHLQWQQGTCDGFVASTQTLYPRMDATVGMGYWTEEDLPFYYGLARTNYHCTAGDESVGRRFARHKHRMARRRMQRIAQEFRSVKTKAQKDLQFTANVFPVGLARYMRHVRGTAQFFVDADNGTLPAFSVVDPDFDDYSEENPQDIARGERFAAEVINRVMQGKGWPRTLLIWLYDEHGGYHDHVSPPAAVPPDDVQGRSVTGSPGRVRTMLRRLMPRTAADAENLVQGPTRYDRYGFRVPAVIVSPYARPDYVCSDVFDHTSLLKLVEMKWNLPALTARDAAATASLAALDLTGPPAFLEPPKLPEPSLKWGSW